MKTHYLRAAAALALVPAIGVPALAHAQARVAAPVIVVVDIERVARECTACVAANASLSAQAQAFETRRTQLQTQLTTEGTPLQTEIQRVQALPAGAARTAAETALRPRLQAFETSQNAAQQELQRLGQNLQSIQQNVARQIQERLGPIYQSVMTARGANIMLPTGATLARSAALDVSADVLAQLNQQLPAVSLTPLPQPTPTPAPAAPPATPRPTGR
jgi:outer membrane protein